MCKIYEYIAFMGYGSKTRFTIGKADRLYSRSWLVPLHFSNGRIRGEAEYENEYYFIFIIITMITQSTCSKATAKLKCSSGQSYLNYLTK